MAFSAGSYHGLNYIAEVTFGTTPAGTPTALRHTSCSLVVTKDGFQSNELRSDRQISDFRHGVIRVQGDIGIEFSYGEFDSLLEGALFSTWDTNVLVAGTTAKSYTLKRRFEDITVEGTFTGCMINTLSLSIPANAMVTGSFGIIGKDGSYASSLSTTPTASQTHSPFDSFTGSITEGGSDIAVVTSIELSLNNGLEPAFVVGADTTPQIVPGRSNLTGTVSAYFENETLLDKFINETESAIVLSLGGATASYEIELPRIKYTGGDNAVSGEGPIVINMPFQALYDSTDETNITITRTPPA